MIDDPIVAEVRRIREEHAAKFGYDLKAIYEDLKRRQAASGRKYVNFPPRRVKPTLEPDPCETVGPK